MQKNNNALNLHFIYIMQCSSFYKIGHSKNPNNRRSSIQTHNPLDVKLIATLKTINHLELEKELHNIFRNSRLRGEWFELNESDLLLLKIEYAFDFKIKIKDSINFNKLEINTQELKSIRFDNSKLDILIDYFEDIFNCKVTNIKTLKYCSINYDTDVVINSIDALFNQEYNAINSINLIKKFCKHEQSKKDNPLDYTLNVIKSVYLNYYNIDLPLDALNTLKKNIKCESVEDSNNILKYLHSKKFYFSKSEMWDKLGGHCE